TRTATLSRTGHSPAVLPRIRAAGSTRRWRERKPPMKKPATVDEYIAAFPEHTRHLQQQMRALVTGVRPDAEERISYGMPTYRVNGRNCVHFAAYTNHLS